MTKSLTELTVTIGNSAGRSMSSRFPGHRLIDHLRSTANSTVVLLVHLPYDDVGVFGSNRAIGAESY